MPSDQQRRGKVGPQLDGVATAGSNDYWKMFWIRTATSMLPSGHHRGQDRRVVVTGLKLREEGGAMIVGDNQGKEVRIPLADIEESRISNLSPMPSNITEQLSEPDLRRCYLICSACVRRLRSIRLVVWTLVRNKAPSS